LSFFVWTKFGIGRVARAEENPFVCRFPDKTWDGWDIVKDAFLFVFFLDKPSWNGKIGSQLWCCWPRLLSAKVVFGQGCCRPRLLLAKVVFGQGCCRPRLLLAKVVVQV